MGLPFLVDRPAGSGRLLTVRFRLGGANKQTSSAVGIAGAPANGKDVRQRCGSQRSPRSRCALDQSPNFLPVMQCLAEPALRLWISAHMSREYEHCEFEIVVEHDPELRSDALLRPLSPRLGLLWRGANPGIPAPESEPNQSAEAVRLGSCLSEPRHQRRTAGAGAQPPAEGIGVSTDRRHLESLGSAAGVGL